MKLRKHLSTIAIAMVTAAVTAGAPAIAHGVQHALFAHDADKVDGKHATGAGAPINKRKGKLVATGANGRLPNNIIAKAPNASRLGGKQPTDYLMQQAIAYAWIDPEGPSLVSERTKNVVGVTRPNDFRYCVELAPGIDATPFAIASPEWGRSAGDQMEVFLDFGASCEEGSVGVITEQAGAGSNFVSFLILFF